MTVFSRFCAVAVGASLAGCTAPDSRQLGRDSVAPVADQRTTANRSTPPSLPRPAIKPSPWQPPAEVDPVPPPVEGDVPAR